MKFSTAALVLATLAVESASAASIKHAHKHAHEKKTVQARNPYEWTPPPGYDYKKDPNYLATASAEAAQPQPTVTASNGNGNNQENTDNTESYTGGGNTGKVAVLAGQHNGDTSNNGFVWKGDSGGEYSNTITNKGADAKIVFVNKGGVNQNGAAMALGEAQWVQTNAPALNFDIASGESLTFQFAHLASGVFFPVRDNMGNSEFGLIKTTLGEFTINGTDTTFDVSRLWFDDAEKTVPLEIKSKEKTCVTSTRGNQCAFVCTSFDYGKTCGEAGTYDLVNDKDEGCHKGPNLATGQPEGGCYVGKNIESTFW